jgi:uncharacterized protein
VEQVQATLSSPSGELSGAAALVSPEPLQPVTATERIFTIDVLRGIALLGVLVANVWLWFSGAVFLFPGLQSELRRITLDSLAFYFVGIFISGKALSTFSFLFGLGFAVQIMRAEARGARIGLVYSRRLAVLLMMGAVHGVLLWYGDILLTYAMLGFALLLFRRRTERTVLVWAVVLVFVLPLILGTIPLILHAAGKGPDKPPAERVAKMTEENRDNLALFTSDSYPTIVRGNLRMLRDMYISPKALGFFMLLGFFLLGLYTGRRRILEDPEAHRRLLRGIVAWGFALGLAGTLAGTALRVVFDVETAIALPWFPLAMMASMALGTVPFALAYIAAITLLLQRPPWRELLKPFGPVGRMALSNYLSQTVICLAIFYGGDLIGTYRPALYLLISLALFAVQIWWSAWWLARYRFGPMEWVWRSLTYGRMQPMRMAAVV